MKGREKSIAFSSQIFEIILCIQRKASFMKSNVHGFYKLKAYILLCIRIEFREKKVLASLINEEESVALNPHLGIIQIISCSDRPFSAKDQQQCILEQGFCSKNEAVCHVLFFSPGLSDLLNMLRHYWQRNYLSSDFKHIHETT